MANVWLSSRMPRTEEELLASLGGSPSLSPESAALGVAGPPAAPAANPLPAPPARAAAKVPAGQKTTVTKKRDRIWDQIEDAIAIGRGLPEFQAQEQGQQAIDQMIAMEAKMPVEADLTPLLHFIDTTMTRKPTGLAQAYKRPETASERNRKLIALAQKSQDDKKDVTKTLADLWTKTKGGSDTTSMLSAIGALAGGRGQSGDEFWKFNQAIRLDKDLSESQEIVRSAGEAKTLLRQAKSVGDKAFQYKFARAMGAAPISDTDVRSARGATGLGDRFDQILADLQNGTFTEENRADYLTVLDALITAAQGRAKVSADKWRQAADLRGLPRNAVDTLLTAPGRTPETSEGGGLPPNVAAILAKPAEQWTAEDEKAVEAYNAGGK